jgi:hypothetical protein
VHKGAKDTGRQSLSAAMAGGIPAVKMLKQALKNISMVF